jgi:hypothetical protein
MEEGGFDGERGGERARRDVVEMLMTEVKAARAKRAMTRCN